MLKRIISGICLVAIAVPSLYFGGWLLYAVCLMVALIGNFELLRVTNLQKTPLGICAYAATIAYFISLNIAEHRYTTLILVVTFLVMMSVYVFTFPKYKAENVMWAFFGIIYVTVMIAYIYETRMSDNGIFIVWLIFIASWGNDTFAYFTGAVYRALVSSKMAGVIDNSSVAFAVASLAGALLSIVGDLAASAIKRNYNVKDYGTLIPGHGGIMDRFDSVIFTAPVVYWAIILLNSIGL